jgi:hypothetical protein
MRNIIEVDPKWLFEIAPHFYTVGDFGDKKENKHKEPMDI